MGRDASLQIVGLVIDDLQDLLHTRTMDSFRLEAGAVAAPADEGRVPRNQILHISLPLRSRDNALAHDSRHNLGNKTTATDS